MIVGIVGFHRQFQLLGRQPAHGGLQLENSDQFVALGADVGNTGIQQFLFGVQDIQHRPRPDLGFAFDAFQGNLVGLVLGFEGFDPGPRGDQRFPGSCRVLDGVAAGLVDGLQLFLKRGGPLV